VQCKTGRHASRQRCKAGMLDEPSDGSAANVDATHATRVNVLATFSITELRLRLPAMAPWSYQRRVDREIVRG
jgi:hypothetical protein